MNRVSPAIDYRFNMVLVEIVCFVFALLAVSRTIRTAMVNSNQYFLPLLLRQVGYGNVGNTSPSPLTLQSWVVRMRCIPCCHGAFAFFFVCFIPSIVLGILFFFVFQVPLAATSILLCSSFLNRCLVVFRVVFSPCRSRCSCLVRTIWIQFAPSLRHTLPTFHSLAVRAIFIVSKFIKRFCNKAFCADLGLRRIQGLPPIQAVCGVPGSAWV